MFKINWDKKIEMTNRMFAMIVISWSISGLILGLAIGLIA